MYWVTYTVTKYGYIYFVLSFLINLLLSSYLALYFGLFGLLFSWIRKKIGLDAALMLSSSIWIITEFLRGHLLTGFPWNLMAYSQYLFLPIIQIGEFFGPYGLSWLIVAFNAAVAYLLIYKKNRVSFRKMLYPGAMIIVFICCLIFGMTRLGTYPTDKDIKVALIQGNTDQGTKWTFDDCNRNLAKHEAMITEAAGRKADLAVLSESALRCFGFEKNSLFGRNMQRISSESGMDILFSSPTYTFVKPGQNEFFNSAVLLRKDGSEPYIYSKVHLVPFGEYIPFRKILFFVDKFAKGVIGDYSAGPDYHTLVMSNGYAMGVGVCYEILFPELMRQFLKQDAEFLANITNDTWYGDTPMPYHHFALSAFRAVENRKYVIRAANSGFSGIVAPDGRIIKRSHLYTQEIIIGTIHPNKIKTVYSRFGDWFVYLNCAVAICLIIVLQKRKRNK